MAGAGFFDPTVLFSTPESRVGQGPRVEPTGCGAYRCQSRNASTKRDGLLERPDRGRHFVLSRWRPAAPWRELGGAPDQALHPIEGLIGNRVWRAGVENREKK